MFANVGNEGALQPDKERYQYKAQPIGSGLIISLPKEDVPASTWIKVAIFTEMKGQLVLMTYLTNGNSKMLPIGQTTYDVVPHGKDV